MSGRHLQNCPVVADKRQRTLLLGGWGENRCLTITAPGDEKGTQHHDAESRSVCASPEVRIRCRTPPTSERADYSTRDPHVAPLIATRRPQIAFRRSRGVRRRRGSPSALGYLLGVRAAGPLSSAVCCCGPPHDPRPRRRTRLAARRSGVHPVCCDAGPVLFLWVPSRSSDESESTLDVLSLNVSLYGRNAEVVGQLIQRLEPDIVGLVEVDREWVKDLGSLDDAYPYRLVEPPGRRAGAALLSKFPLGAPEIRPLADTRLLAAACVSTDTSWRSASSIPHHLSGANERRSEISN